MINRLYERSQSHSAYSIHCVLMFIEADAHVIQMLEELRYYQALDAITGDNIALFHTRLFQGRIEMPSPPPGFYNYMVPVWKEPKENKQLLELFDMKDSASLPCLITFLFTDGDIYCAQSKIKTDSSESAFNSLKEILERLVKVAQRGENRLATMKAAQFQMRALNIRKSISEFLGKLGTVRGAIGI